MSGQRLKLQFQRLYTHFNGQNSDTNLQDIADVLFCTRRNVRMVINKMVDEGWINWQPAVGRGKQSHLTFHSSDSELQLNHARKLVADGKLEPALSALDNNADKLAQLIQEQLGLSHHLGKQIVRLPYYRSFEALDPLKPLRRSEQHLIRQIFNGLTLINEEKEEVEGDIAHAWEMLSPQHWRFYLRPSVRFHDGKLLDVQDVISTFERVKEHRLYWHIHCVKSSYPNTVDFILSEPDVHFAELVANISAVIQPADAIQRKDFDHFPIGTGPYRVIENNKQRLKLEAFDHYFGFRALTDIVEIWILSGTTACYIKPSEVTEIQPSTLFSGRFTLDEGCNYLLFNRQTGICAQQEWLDYLNAKLTPLNLLKHLDPNELGDFRFTNAYGLLPGWIHNSLAEKEVNVPSKRTITLAYQMEHPIYPYLSTIIAKLLAEDGIKLKTYEISYEDLLSGKGHEKVDIWLNGMSLGSRRPEAFLPWFYNHDFIYQAMPANEFALLQDDISLWRSLPDKAFPSEKIARHLVNAGQMMPLFYVWVGIDDTGQWQGMESNSMGWFDFKSVWLKP
ncbi:TPA: HTH-type transcriptional regulator SgrR [Photobacterium damselae]